MDAKFIATLDDSNYSLESKRRNNIDVVIEYGGNALEIKPKGYGTYSMAKGQGAPIILEVYEGRLRLIVWPDINKEDPIIFDLERAREDKRKGEGHECKP